MDNIKLSQEQKDYIKKIIDNFETNDKNETFISISKAHELLESKNIISTRSKLSTPKMKLIFDYITKVHSTHDNNEPYLLLKKDFTLQQVKDYVNQSNND